MNPDDIEILDLSDYDSARHLEDVDRLERQLEQKEEECADLAQDKTRQLADQERYIARARREVDD
jgi:hypothetical protein